MTGSTSTRRAPYTCLFDDQPVQELVEEYVSTCASLSIAPDGGLLSALSSRARVFKAAQAYTESHLLALIQIFFRAREKSIPLCFHTLHFRAGQIGSNGALLLARLLEEDKHVQVLNLANNRIGPRGMEAFARVLEKGENTTLRRLNLHGNRAYHRGAVALSRAIRTGHHSIEYIDASNNHIGFAGVRKLQSAVAACNEIREKTSRQRVNISSENAITANMIANFVFEEMWNSISHGIGFFIALILTIITFQHAAELGRTKVMAAGVYCFSLMFLYACSCLYHSFFKLGTSKKIFQRLDHAAIFVLIAGSYTPLLWGGPLDGYWGRWLLAFVWFIAVVGIILVCFFFDQYPMFELFLYLLQGWVALALGPVVYEHWHALISGEAFSIEGLLWYAAGGLVYTSGVVFFIKGDKIPIYHAVWHGFVVVASICHWIACYYYVLPHAPPDPPYWTCESSSHFTVHHSPKPSNGADSGLDG